jgi:hypothetical protein
VDDRSFRTEFVSAIDAVAPPAPWLRTAVRDGLRQRRREGWMDRAQRKPAQTRFAIAGLTMAVLAVLVVAALLLAQFYASRQTPAPAVPPPSTTLTIAEKLQLAQLEARPLQFPPMPANGQCPDGPHSNITPYSDGSSSYVWGNGTVFVEGGNGLSTSKSLYFDVTFFTDPTVSGVVLIRGRQLGGRLNVVYVGDYAAGAVVGSDSIGGKAETQYVEAAVPADRPPSNTNAAPGWGIWKIRQGIDRSYSGCTGFQFDTASGSQVIVAYDPAGHGPT